ncbi:MAG: hypothetical protein LBH68_08705 [Bifidobacteriaceae bacterium]|nr:hypothetical protein [Bifidobacteriaceae bacterium]
MKGSERRLSGWAAPPALNGLMALLVAAIAGLVVLAAPVQATWAAEDSRSAADHQPPVPVVVIGLTGVTWSDVSTDESPTLSAALSNAALAVNLVNQGRQAGACPAQGWLALGAGTGAPQTVVGGGGEETDPQPLCGALPEPVAGQVPGWEELTAVARMDRAPDQLGQLGPWIEEAGVSAVAVGPGAAVALADSAGRLTAGYQPTPTDSYADPLRQGWEEPVSAALAEGAGVVVIDVTSGGRQTNLATLDQRIGAVLRGLARENTSARIVIASLTVDQPPDFGLGLLIERWPPGPRTAPLGAGGLIESRATKTPGLGLTWELTDVIKSYVVPAPVGPVNPWSAAVTDVSPRYVLDRLTDMRQHAEAASNYAPIGFAVVLLIAVVAMFGPLLVNGARREPVTGWRTEFMALTAGALPAAGFMAGAVPWWRTPAPLVIWCLLTVAFALVTAILAWWAGRLARWPILRPAIVGLVTAAVLIADPFLGGRFIRDTPMGYETLLGARFYGYSNPAFAVLVTGGLLACVVVAGWAWQKGWPRLTATVVGAVGLVVVVVDGAPPLGADLGGGIGAAVAFVVAALLAADVRLTKRRLLGAVGAGAAVGVALAVVDYLRGPEKWTHLGGFVDSLIHGQAWSMLLGKGLAWARLSLVPLVVFGLAALLLRWVWKRGGLAPVTSKAWRRQPLLKPVAGGLLVAAAIGSLVNDSGLVVAACVLAVCGPLFTAALVRTARDAAADAHGSSTA